MLWRFVLWSLAIPAFVGIASAQLSADYELPPILYSKATPQNRINELQQQVDNGSLDLSQGSNAQRLLRFLEAMQVSADSQVLVFSKTSLQRDLIDPQRPRALYFSEDAYIGWVPGGVIECAVTDPQLGIVFYEFDPRAPRGEAQFTRNEQCLSCHAGSATHHWPGLVVRSVFPDADGNPVTSAGGFFVTHETPLTNRWGGWYVTGTHGKHRHMGNATVVKTVNGNAILESRRTQNLKTLPAELQTMDFPRRDSDIIALMVLEHQIAMHNALAQGALRARKWVQYEKDLAKELGKEPSSRLEPEGTARRIIQSEAAKIVELLLFCGEASLPESGIAGSGDFERAFLKNKKMDPRGRSLKDFDLKKRMFKYPCSYMIYSQAFTALPELLKAEVWHQLAAALSATGTDAKFAHLTESDRRAIRDILQATHDQTPRPFGPDPSR